MEPKISKKNEPQAFHFDKMWEDLLATFVFGDKINAKAVEIGVTYNDFARMRRDMPVSIDVILKAADYLTPRVEGCVDVGAMAETLAKYINHDYFVQQDV